jgi:hypothetical protein
MGFDVRPEDAFGGDNFQRARFTPNLYWQPSTKNWVPLDAANLTPVPRGRFDMDHSVDVQGATSPIGVWPLVNGNWQNVKEEHPNAVWSLRDGKWYIPGTSPGPGGTDGDSAAARALQQRLAEIERMPNTDAITKNQLKARAYRDYEQQTGATPP